MTRHGFPTAKLYGGISFVTTLPAPITHPSPMVTPPQTTTLDASQQLKYILKVAEVGSITEAAKILFISQQVCPTPSKKRKKRLVSPVFTAAEPELL